MRIEIEVKENDFCSSLYHSIMLTSVIIGEPECFSTPKVRTIRLTYLHLAVYKAALKIDTQNTLGQFLYTPCLSIQSGHRHVQ
jgi:hypothetical protein